MLFPERFVGASSFLCLLASQEPTSFGLVDGCCSYRDPAPRQFLAKAGDGVLGVALDVTTSIGVTKNAYLSEP